LAELDRIFAALADPIRRQMLFELANGERSVGELAEPFPISLPAISKHLTVLERAGLVARWRDGRVRRCRLVAEPLEEAFEWIGLYGRFWEDRLDSLERHLNEREADGGPGH
jgi:DNA-binding transcriptional ArsR family regulator